MPVVQSGVLSKLLYGPMHIFHAFASNRQHTTTETTPIDALLRGRPEFKSRPVLTSKRSKQILIALAFTSTSEPEDRESTRQHFCLRPGQSTHLHFYLKGAIFSLLTSPSLRFFFTKGRIGTWRPPGRPSLEGLLVMHQTLGLSVQTWMPA